MRKIIFLLSATLISAISFSQTDDKDSSEQILKDLCDGPKLFDRCEIPVDYRFSKAVLEDSLTNYLKGTISQFQNGKAYFVFIVAKDSKVYDVKMISGNITDGSAIIKALYQTSGLWTVGRQNSHPICSFVKLDIEFTDNRVTAKLRR